MIIRAIIENEKFEEYMRGRKALEKEGWKITGIEYKVTTGQANMVSAVFERQV